MRWKILFACLASLCLTVEVSLAAMDAKRFDNLSASEKSHYKGDASYLDICSDPKRFAKQENAKFKFKVIFGKTASLPAKYSEVFPKTYGMLVLDGPDPISLGLKTVLVVFPTLNDKLHDDIKSLEASKAVIVYASVKSRVNRRKDASRKDCDSELLHVLCIDDIDIPDPSIKENAGLPQDNDFIKGTLREVDITPGQLLDNALTLSICFKGLEGKLPPMIAKLTEFSDATHLQILPAEAAHTPLIIAKDNESVKTLLNAKMGDKMILYGVLKAVEDPTSRQRQPVYFLFVYRLDKDNAPAPGTGKPPVIEKKGEPPSAK
jgi:hypothetical protein